ncbi:MAG: hypothetical protein Q9208_001421 [Pyrenodesmia sp. 3 TL-2023]
MLGKKHGSFVSDMRNIVIILLLLFGHVLTFPATTSSEPDVSNQNDTVKATKLIPRYNVVSTEDYFRDILQTAKVYSFPGVFWTSYPRDIPMVQQGFWKAREWAREMFGRDRFVMYDTVSDTFPLIMSPPNCDWPTDEQDTLRVQHMSKAFAAAVYGTAYLVMPDDAPVYPESYWTIFEWPLITRNRFVERVIRVDLPSERQSVFWSKGDGHRGTTPPPGKREIKALSLSQRARDIP